MLTEALILCIIILQLTKFYFFYTDLICRVFLATNFKSIYKEKFIRKTEFFNNTHLRMPIYLFCLDINNSQEIAIEFNMIFLL